MCLEPKRCLAQVSFLPFLLQENVSCLNTSLVILMLARRRAKLPFYLNALREKEYAEKYPGFLLNNFHNLLRFWQRHYLNKDKDSTCLENVSRSVNTSRVGAGTQARTTGLDIHVMEGGERKREREQFCVDESGHVRHPCPLTSSDQKKNVYCSNCSLVSPQSSCIPFSYWKETVSVLLGADRTSLCAIASYIDEPFMDLDRDLLED